MDCNRISLSVAALVEHATSLLLVVRTCAEKGLFHTEVQQVLDVALSSCRPICQTNYTLYQELEKSVQHIASELRNTIA